METRVTPSAGPWLLLRVFVDEVKSLGGSLKQGNLSFDMTGSHDATASCMDTAEGQEHDRGHDDTRARKPQ